MMEANSKSSLLFLYLLAAILCCSSCIIPSHDIRYYGKVVNITSIKPGVTTKEEVFLQYGNFKISDDEKLFTARYHRIEGVDFLITKMNPGDLFPLLSAHAEHSLWCIATEEYEIEIEFDDNDVVKRCEKFKLPRNQSQENQVIENK
jgi:hypothetical protein